MSRRRSARARALAASRHAPLGRPGCPYCGGSGYAVVGEAPPAQARPDGSIPVRPPPVAPCSCRAPRLPAAPPAPPPLLDRMRQAAGEREPGEDSEEEANRA
jgi:hypothetical protein